MFSPTFEDFHKQSVETTTHIYALVQILVDKEIITEPEWQQYLQKAKEHLSEELEKQKEERLLQIEADNPHLAQMIRKQWEKANG